MFHALALVEIENGGAEHLLKSLFQITFVDGDLPAEGFDRERLADLAEEYFPGADDLFPVCFVGEELTLESFHFFLADHAFEAIQEQHLALRIDKNVLQAVGIGMVQQGLEYQACPAAERKGFGEGDRMLEINQVFTDGVIRLAGPDELGKMDGLEAEAEYIDCLDAFRCSPVRC